MMQGMPSRSRDLKLIRATTSHVGEPNCLHFPLKFALIIPSERVVDLPIVHAADRLPSAERHADRDGPRAAATPLVGGGEAHGVDPAVAQAATLLAQQHVAPLDGNFRL